MATPPFQVEDQTDEDFFDKLVDDDGSSFESPIKSLSNLSLDEMTAAFGDAGDIKIDSARNNSEDFSQIDNTVEKDILVAEESISLVSSNSVVFDAVLESSDSAEKDFALENVTGKSESSGSTSVKEIQWSSFNADGADYDAGGFGSYSDFFHELGGDSGDQFGKRSNDFTKMASQWNSAPVVVKNQVSDARSDENSEETISGRANREENQGYSMNSDQTIDEQAVNGSSQYWENLYPGWRVDPKTGEWYQLDGYDASGSNEQENCQEQEQFFSNGNNIFAGQNSEISYLQQTSQSVVGTVAEGCTTGSVSNWTQPAHGNTDYPPNFVFDAQYPGWYYDTITQQWDLLETYHETVQAGGASPAAVSKHVQMQPEAGFPSGGFADKDFSFQSQGQGGDWDGSTSGYAHGTDQAQVSFSQQNMWYSGGTANSGAVGSYLGDHQTSGQFISGVNLYDPSGNVKNYADQQTGFKESDTVSLYGQTNPGYDNSKSGMGSQSFAPVDNSYLFNSAQAQQNQQTDYSHDYYGSQKSIDYSMQPYQTATSSSTQFLHGLPGGRTSAGRPPHALVTFGFGGKLIVMKDSSSFGSYSTHGGQDSIGGLISIHNLVDVVTGKTNAASIGTCEYVLALCRQSFPGPLVGANVASKELNKWIDERIANCESSNLDFRKAELLRLLLSLLKICCQNYGKLRSPFGADAASQESDGPESAVTKLFASAKKNGAQLSEYGAFTPCLQSFPSEGQIRATSVEVQNLLVSGRRKEALECAQEGQLWGPALVLAAQFGEKFYVDTVKQMAHRQFVSGSPLRTLCLLIAGQPADVFSTDTSISSSLSGGGYVSQQPAQIRVNGMIDDWEENLAIITANRTKDDELVIVHLGDCLWKEKDEVTAAHTCYLVAEANFESFSDTARLCLIGADHWKCPRTYASPEAIQRTELYEYAKVLGNSQFILPPFQPYKIIYAHMLAEVGKISESLKYCQAISKSLKNAGRTHEVELWKSMLSSLEERIRTHQQGGYGTNLAPSKLVGKIIPFLDTTIHRIIGAPPPPLPPLPPSSTQHIEHDTHSVMPKIANSSSKMTFAPLMPSASMEPISEWTADNSRMTMPNRSISEPDFGRNPVQKASSLKDGGPSEARSKGTAGGPSRFGRFGSQILQKTMGWVSRSRPDRQAKLGDTNKFYYDEKLKRWVEEGAEPPAEETALPPPPPTTATFQNGALDYNINNGFRSPSLPANAPETKSPVPVEQSSGIPPIPTSTNQFSARGHMGVRSRYVDTFNKGSATPKNLFQSPTVPVAKPVSGAKFFIPTPTVSADQTLLTGEVATSEDPSLQATTSSPSPLSSASSLSSSSINRFPSMDNIAPIGSKGMGFTRNGNGPLSSRSRAASWSGSFSERKMAEIKSQSETFGIPSMALPPPVNGGGSFGRCAIKLERAAERCISVLLELIKIKVNYVVQEAIIVIKDIFRRYPNTYESIIATLCESLDTLDEPEAKASMIWIIGEYAERIDNADELLESFLESFPEEPALVQLQLLTATVKLFLKKPTEGPQQMIQVVLNNATIETDNPDLRDRAYIYWRLLSTDPEAAKDVVLAEKPVISDDSNQLDSSLLDELLANIATLSSVYHKPPDAFVSRVKPAIQRQDDEEYPDGVESTYSESPAHDIDGLSVPASSSNAPQASTRQAAPTPPAPAAPVPDLLGDLIGLDNAIVPVDQPTIASGPPLPILLQSASGQGLQISGQLERRDGQIFYSLLFENNSQIPLDGFMIQFNKNSFGLAAAGTLQVPQLQPGTSARSLLPMVLFQNVSPGPPSSLLQVAVKNLQQPVWYFSDKIPLQVFFSEDGRMERSNFLETWKSLPDSHEIVKDMGGAVINNVDMTLDKLAASNLFFIAKRRNANQEVLYLSVKVPRNVPFLIELTAVVGIPGVKCAIKTPNPEMAPLFFQAMEALLVK